MSWHPWCQLGNLPRNLWVALGCSAWHALWQVWNFPRSLSMGGPALQTRLLWPRVQVSWVCLLARCVYSDLGHFYLEPKCHGWLTAILLDMWLHLVLYTLYYLNWTNDILLVLLSTTVHFEMEQCLISENILKIWDCPSRIHREKILGASLI